MLAWEHDELRCTLVDGRQRAADFLTEAVRRLELGDRVDVVHGRAEELGRDATRRASTGMVVARGFGRPAVVAECGAPLLAPGGWLVVSEPPRPAPERWPADPLRALGLAVTHRWVAGSGHFVALSAVHACPDRYPRRVGVPAKRPLWA